MNDAQDTQEQVKPTYEEMVTLLNPAWQHCRWCDHFHPTSSAC